MSEFDMETARKMMNMQEQLIRTQALYIQALQTLNERCIPLPHTPSTASPAPPEPSIGTSGVDASNSLLQDGGSVAVKGADPVTPLSARVRSTPVAETLPSVTSPDGQSASAVDPVPPSDPGTGPTETSDEDGPRNAQNIQERDDGPSHQVEDVSMEPMERQEEEIREPEPGPTLEPEVTQPVVQTQDDDPPAPKTEPEVASADRGASEEHNDHEQPGKPHPSPKTTEDSLRDSPKTPKSRTTELGTEKGHSKASWFFGKLDHDGYPLPLPEKRPTKSEPPKKKARISLDDTTLPGKGAALEPQKKRGPPGIPASSFNVESIGRRSTAGPSALSVRERKQLIETASSSKVVPFPYKGGSSSTVPGAATSNTTPPERKTVLTGFLNPRVPQTQRRPRPIIEKRVGPSIWPTPRAVEKDARRLGMYPLKGKERERQPLERDTDGSQGSSSPTLVQQKGSSYPGQAAKRPHQADGSKTSFERPNKRHKSASRKPYVLLNHPDSAWVVINVESAVAETMSAIDADQLVSDMFNGDCPELTDSGEEEDGSEFDQLESDSQAAATAAPEEAPPIETLKSNEDDNDDNDSDDVCILLSKSPKVVSKGQWAPSSSSRYSAGARDGTDQDNRPSKVPRSPHKTPSSGPPEREIRLVGPPKSARGDPKSRREDENGKLASPTDKPNQSGSSKREKKGKGQETALSEESVAKRLTGNSNKDVSVDSSIKDVAVTRRFITRTFGGARGFMSKSKSHDYHFLFPSSREHPEAPCQPGHSGLICTVPGDIDPIPKRLYKIFYGLEKSRDETPPWLYLGDYIITAAEPLSPEEFRALDISTKRAWAKRVWEHANATVCHRIILRDRLRREPEAEEVQAAITAMRTGTRNRAGRPSLGTNEGVIISAFEEGKEELGIFLLKFSTYDEAFQRKLADDFKTFDPSAVAPRGKATSPRQLRHESSPEVESEDDD